MRQVFVFLGPAAIGLAVLLICATDSAFARERRGRSRRGMDTSPALGETAPDFEMVTLKWLLMSDKERARAKAKAEAEAKRRAARTRRGRTNKARAGEDATDKGTTPRRPDNQGSRPTGDSETKTEDVKIGHARLSSFRGRAPVVFVLASYT